MRSLIGALGKTYREAAVALGLSLSGLNHQMRSVRRVSRQTEILLERLEADHRHRLRNSARPRHVVTTDARVDEAAPGGDEEERVTR